MKIDAIRSRIQKLKSSHKISSNLYYYLLCSLLECADKVANTASVYGAYLKQLKASAKKNLVLVGAFPIDARNMTQKDAAKTIQLGFGGYLNRRRVTR